MTSSSPNDEIDSDFEVAVRRKLATHENIVDYEIKEATAGYVLVEVTERMQDGSIQQILYQLEFERGLDGEENIHWANLGPVAENDSSGG